MLMGVDGQWPACGIVCLGLRARAQTRIDDERLVDDVTASLRALMSLSKHLRRQRIERGALALASPEVKFDLKDGDAHDAMDMGMYQVCKPEQLCNWVRVEMSLVLRLLCQVCKPSARCAAQLGACCGGVVRGV